MRAVAVWRERSMTATSPMGTRTDSVSRVTSSATDAWPVYRTVTALSYYPADTTAPRTSFG